MKKILLGTSVSVMLALTGCQTTKTLPPTHPHTTHWGYTAGEITPEHWGDEEVNKLCKIGQTQSPINITTATKARANQFNLVPHYQPQEFKITNNGHSIVYTATNPAASTLTLNGQDYQLLQFHYHIPSEHTVMNASFPLELHFVHKNAQNQLAVVGVLVSAGQMNANLQPILGNLPTNLTDSTTLGQFNVSTLIPNSPVYAYNGSLTTPPCSEQVQWLLKVQPIQASPAQLNTLNKLYHNNNRPVQPLAGRTVYLAP